MRYRKTKERTYIFFGLTWIGVVEAYYAVSISFIFALYKGVGLAPEIYFLIGIPFYPITSVLWITAFTDILYKDKQRIFQLIFLIIGITFEIIFFYLLFTAPQYLGTLLSPVDSKFGLIVTIYILFLLCVIFSTGVILAISSIKSDDPRYKLRGKFLLVTLITFVTGAALDAAIELNIITLIIIRLILITSAFEFYCAFILPKWLRKIALKE